MTEIRHGEGATGSSRGGSQFDLDGPVLNHNVASTGTGPRSPCGCPFDVPRDKFWTPAATVMYQGDDVSAGLVFDAPWFQGSLFSARLGRLAAVVRIRGRIAMLEKQGLINQHAGADDQQRVGNVEVRPWVEHRYTFEPE